MTNQAEALRPSSPLGIQATPGDGSIALTWLSPVELWEVRWRRSTDSEYGEQDAVKSLEPSAEIPGLENDVEYAIQVRGENSYFGEGYWSREVLVKPVAPVLPAAPTGLTPTPGRGAITWSWDEVADATGYKLRWRQSGDEWFEVGVSGLSHTVTGLDFEEYYEAQVRAFNESGDGPWSAVHTTSDGGTLPLEPATELGNLFVESEDWVWPYDDLSVATVTLRGGDGGHGGQGGRGLDGEDHYGIHDGLPGSRGDSGRDTVLSHPAVGDFEASGGSGGAGGVGGRAGAGSGNPGHPGAPGEPGELASPEFTVIEGLSRGDILQIVIGAPGSGGAGGIGGRLVENGPTDPDDTGASGANGERSGIVFVQPVC